MGRITGYKIKLDRSVSRVLPSKTQHALRGLKAYTLYRVTMKAISVVGEGMWSDVRVVTTLASGRSHGKNSFVCFLGNLISYDSLK